MLVLCSESVNFSPTNPCSKFPGRYLTYSAPVIIMEQKLREKLKVPHFVKKRPCLEVRVFSITKTGYIVITLLLARLAFCKIYSNIIPLLTPSVHCPIKILFIFAIFRAYNCLNLGKGTAFVLKCRQSTTNPRRANFFVTSST
jgi:hypothetical protein